MAIRLNSNGNPFTAGELIKSEDMNDTFGYIENKPELIRLRNSGLISVFTSNTTYTLVKSFDFTATGLNQKIYGFVCKFALRVVSGDLGYLKIEVIFSDDTSDIFETTFDNLGDLTYNHFIKEFNYSTQIKTINIYLKSTEGDSVRIWSTDKNISEHDWYVSYIQWLSFGTY